MNIINYITKFKSNIMTAYYNNTSCYYQYPVIANSINECDNSTAASLTQQTNEFVQSTNEFVNKAACVIQKTFRNYIKTRYETIVDNWNDSDIFTQELVCEIPRILLLVIRNDNGTWCDGYNLLDFTQWILKEKHPKHPMSNHILKDNVYSVCAMRLRRIVKMRNKLVETECSREIFYRAKQLLSNLVDRELAAELASVHRNKLHIAIQSNMKNLRAVMLSFLDCRRYLSRNVKTNSPYYDLLSTDVTSSNLPNTRNTGGAHNHPSRKIRVVQLNSTCLMNLSTVLNSTLRNIIVPLSFMIDTVCDEDGDAVDELWSDILFVPRYNDPSLTCIDDSDDDSDYDDDDDDSMSDESNDSLDDEYDELNNNNDEPED